MSSRHQERIPYSHQSDSISYDSSPDNDLFPNQNINNSKNDRNHVDQNPSYYGLTPPPQEAQLTYSPSQVRFVTSLIVLLYITGSTTSSLIPQYLLDRWTAEAGHNRSHSSNESVCDRNESDSKNKMEDDIQARVSIAYLYYNIATCAPAVVSSVIFGALVDLVGRRPAIISAIFGYCLKCIVLILILRFDLNTNLFYLSYALDGVCGGYFTALIGIFSVTADINSNKGHRTFWFAIITGIGAVTGAASNIGLGYLIQYISYLSAASALVGLLILALLCTIFFLPETLPPAIKQTLTFKSLGKNVMQMYHLYIRDGSKAKRCALFLSLMIFFTSVLNMVTLTSTDTLYQRHQPFCWTPTKIGFYGAFKSFSQAILGLIYLKIHQRIGCATDEVMSMIGMLFMAACFILEAFVKNTWQMYMVPIVAIPSYNVAPITRAVMSYLAGPHRQGVLFSSIAVIEALCNMTSVSAYNKVYAATVDFLPGAVYFVMAGVAIVTFLLYIPFFYFYEHPSKTHERFMNPDEDQSNKGNVGSC